MIRPIIAGVLAAVLTAAAPGRDGDQKPAAAGAPQHQTALARIESLIASMTLDEKISMLYGTTDPASHGQAGYLAGVPRLGIPPLRLADGPAGIRTAEPATALPAPVAMASTFSPGLARQYGQVIGRDARARSQNIVLAPMVNIVRVPQAGRNFETLGEDPLLASRLVAAEVDGIQSEGAIATVKHFAFNNQEYDRMTVSADIDEQTMREIELPGFEAAVRAGAGSVMASYNKVNGTYAAENPLLLRDILRRDWGFKGFVMSDWFATHDALASITAGMEMEMPTGRYFGSLGEAVKKGELNESVINEAVRRILSAMEVAGLLNPSAAGHAAPQIPASSPAAREIAVAGAVLLKNEGGVLPLGKEELQSLAVIGHSATMVVVGGGGSANVRPMHTEIPLEVLKRRAGTAARIAYAKGYEVDGEPVPPDALRPNAALRFLGTSALPAGSSLTWTGEIVAPRTGEYVLKVQTGGGRGSISFGSQGTGRQGGTGRRGAAAAGRAGTAPGGAVPEGAFPGGMVPDNIPGFGAAALLPTADGLSNVSTPIRLEAGVPVPITITASGGRAAAPLEVRLAWVTPDIRQARIDEAVRAAKAARAAVVFAYDEGTEGRDRGSLSLPGYQDALIEAVAAANPRTIVVLNNGAPIEMPWADRVAGILQMWYPGQEGADATIAILLGEASPGGRLPVTFPRHLEDSPTSRPERYPGVNGSGVYSEGIFVGYRWYDQQRLDPLFPFGHGLSYTSFAYSGLSVRPASDGYDVKFTIRNTGSREGVEVAQIYIGPPPNPPAPMAVKKLSGFERVSLAPGQTRQITVHIETRCLSYWSSADHRWTLAAGPRTFMVGASSRDIKLQSEVAVRAPR